jgi:very-short-patch-repair endonuclease
MSAGAAFARRLRRDASNAEAKLSCALRAHRLAGLQFRRQAPCGPYVAAHLVIEVDGATHSTGQELAHDRSRDAWFASHGWRVLRFWNEEVYRNFDGVIDTILSHLPDAPSPPLPRCAGEGADCSLHEDSYSRAPALPSPAQRGRAREGAE